LAVALIAESAPIEHTNYWWSNSNQWIV